MPAAAFILPAGGLGTRMGSDRPKQFLQLAGKPLLVHALERIRSFPETAEIALSVPADLLGWARETFAEDFKRLGVAAVVAGGESRKQSVANALAALATKAELVAVHDAVRPFLTARLVRELCREALAHGAALPVLPVTDTVKRAADGAVRGTVARDGLFTVQTPQVFRLDVLREAYARAAGQGAEITDDAMLVEQCGYTVRAVAGERFNLKITTPPDLDLAEALLAAKLV